MNEFDIYREVMAKAFCLATESPDPSTQNSALLFDEEWNLATWAVNKFPFGVGESQQRWTRPVKYHFVEHAERNVIYQAARLGVPTEGLTMVAVWASCSDCARAIIQAGITTLVRYKIPPVAHWSESVDYGEEMLKEAGVAVITLSLEYSQGEVPSLLLNGERWFPSQ